MTDANLMDADCIHGITWWQCERCPTASHFLDDRHALYVGWVLGAAMRAGVPVEPVADQYGNWTDRIRVPFGSGVTITLVVPPPPDDWTVRD